MNLLSALTRVLREVLGQSRYIKVAIIAMALMGYLNYWLLYQVTTIPEFFRMAYQGEFGPYSVGYAWISAVFTVLTVILFGIGTALLYWLYRHSRLRTTSGAWFGGGGALFSAFGAACPVCGAFLLQLVGVAGGMAAFPLKGLEFKLLSFGLLAASTLVSAKKIEPLLDKECSVCVPSQTVNGLERSAPLGGPLPGAVSTFLIAVLALNHILIGQVAAATGAIKPSNGGFFKNLFSIKSASAQSIISTKLNPDGRTTTLAEWPTISEIPANPNSGDPVADAKVVMIPTGTPFYAPEGISFDDPVGALDAWGKYEKQIKLSADLEARWKKITNTMTCDYCCGGPTNVTVINRCGCNHAQAWRSIAKYLLQNYGDKYSDEQIIGELHRWKGAWYPKGVIEDYLLAIGKSELIGHQTHGGAGSDGRHGF